MFTLGVVLTFKGVRIHCGQRESHISCCSQSGDVVNHLEILFMVGGLRVICNLNTLVIDRVTIEYIYL